MFVLKFRYPVSKWRNELCRDHRSDLTKLANKLIKKYLPCTFHCTTYSTLAMLVRVSATNQHPLLLFSRKRAFSRSNRRILFISFKVVKVLCGNDYASYTGNMS